MNRKPEEHVLDEPGETRRTRGRIRNYMLYPKRNERPMEGFNQGSDVVCILQRVL